jgi:hypothetical protein
MKTLYVPVNININSKTIMAIREISSVIIATPYVFWKNLGNIYTIIDIIANTIVVIYAA